MANKWAIQNGNWSDGSTWNDGVVPTAADDVWLNGHIVNVAANTSISIGGLSNYSDSGVGLAEGGKIHFEAGCQLFVENDIYAKDMIIEFKGSVPLQYRKFYSFTTQAWANTNLGRQNCSVYCLESNSYTYTFNFTGDIETDENSLGMFFSSAYPATSGFTTMNITGNIIHRGGYISRSIQGRQGSGSLVGNITAYAQPFPDNWVQDYNTLIVGDINCQFSGYFLPGTTNHYGDAILGEKVVPNLSDYHNYGTVTTYNDGSSGNYLLVVNVNTILNNFIDRSDTETVPYLFSWQPPSSFTINGLFSIRKKTRVNYHNSYGFLGINILHAKGDARIEMGSSNCIFFNQLSIENPDRFSWSWIEDAVGTNWTILPVGQQLSGYPQEQDVANGVQYGMYGELNGRLQLPAEGTVVKGVEYGDKVGTLEVIALSGATAQSENIAVVNLTEQQLQRVGNCATVSTVQKCFEDFKE